MTRAISSKLMYSSWALLLICIQYSDASPEPLVSQGGMMPMHRSPPVAAVAAVQEAKEVEPAQPQPAAAPLAKRQDAKGNDLTDQQLNLLLSSFPNDDEASSNQDASPTITIPVPTMPVIIVSHHPSVKSSQVYYFDQSPSASSSSNSPLSFSSPMINMESPSVLTDNSKIQNATSIRFVDNFEADKPKPIEFGRKISAEPTAAPKKAFEFGRKINPEPPVPNDVRADEKLLEKDIFAQSVKEDINRQVVDAKAKQMQQSIDSNLIMRQASKSKPKALGPPPPPKSAKNDSAANEEGAAEENHALFEHQKDISKKKVAGSGIPMYKPGPPWEDERIVGKLRDEMAFSPTEISHKIAVKLCSARKRVADKPPFSEKPTRYYLWAPINQYVPLIHKGYPIRPPLFAPQCLKWVLRPCRGVLRRPLVKPCTYWAPMPIRRPECGFMPNIQTKLVNYRPPSFVPGNCPCVWPCTKRFDPIQRCRVETPEKERHLDTIHADGDPWHEGEIRMQELLAAQLCRGMKLALTTRQVVPIGWIPMRIESIDKSSEPEEPTTTKKESAAEVESQFRRKRSTRAYTKKKRQVVDKKKFYNPDAVLEPDNGFKGRSLKEPNENELDAEDGNEGVGISFSEMSSYDPDKYRTNAAEDALPVPTCIEWRYKACPKGQSSEELHLAKIEEEGKNATEVEEKKGLSRRSTFKQRRRKVHKRNGARFAGPFSVASIQYQRSEGHGRIRKRHDENDDDFDGNSLAQLGIPAGAPEIGCGEWHYSESQHCVLEERVGMSARINQIMITGVIESNEDEDEDDDDLMEEVKKVDTKTVKELCPGSPGKFPCFLKRRKRDANETEAADEGNSTLTEGEEPPQEEPINNHDSAEAKVIAEEQKAKEEQIPEMPVDTQSSAVNYANQIQMLPDSACMCDWPCLPFFDKINRCYDHQGNTIDSKGKYIYRSFRRAQRSPVACINFVETDEIYCKVKDKHE